MLEVYVLDNLQYCFQLNLSLSRQTFSLSPKSAVRPCEAIEAIEEVKLCWLLGSLSFASFAPVSGDGSEKVTRAFLVRREGLFSLLSLVGPGRPAGIVGGGKMLTSAGGSLSFATLPPLVVGGGGLRLFGGLRLLVMFR